MSLFKSKKFYLILGLVLAVVSAALVIFNLDVVLRFAQAAQDGTLSLEKIRNDLAAFDLGKSFPVTPIAQKTSPQDGMVQVFVPAGEFSMGRKNAHWDSGPEHKVYLDAFWMDQVEVSNAMYLKCLAAGGCTLPVSNNIYYNNWIYRDHPIIYVDWYQANQYCQWAGRRLPTEAEWEKAARGTDGRLYPWGNEPPNPSLANYAGNLIHTDVSVYRYPLGASPYGALNMAGNVREWILDWFSPDYYSVSPDQNPLGPATGFERSLRSGSYNEDGREILATKRYSHEPQSAGLSRGFRCVEDAAPAN